MAIDERQMITVARDVADFAHRQGVGEAVAVDHLVTAYTKAMAEADRYRAVLERCHRILGHPSRETPRDSVTRIIDEALRDGAA